MPQRLPRELVIHTVDSVGNPVDVVFGIVTDKDGRERMALAVGDDGPTALLSYNDGTGPNILPIAHRVFSDVVRNNTTP